MRHTSEMAPALHLRLRQCTCPAPCVGKTTRRRTQWAEGGVPWCKVGSHADSQRCKCPPRLLMQKVIRFALIAVGLLGIIQVLWTQSGGFSAQTRQPEQSMPEGEGGSSLAATPELLPSPEVATVIVNLPAARTPSGPPLRTTRVFTDRESLTRALQSELRRVGCYDGYINGDWTASSRNAMKAFTDYVNARLPVDKPDIVLLSLIQGYEGKACRGSCPTGQNLKDGHCIPNALIVHAKKPENVAPLMVQTSSHPTQAAALADFDTDGNQASVTPQPVSPAPKNPRARNATGPPPEPQRVRSFGPSIFSLLARSSQ